MSTGAALSVATTQGSGRTCTTKSQAHARTLQARAGRKESALHEALDPVRQRKRSLASRLRSGDATRVYALAAVENGREPPRSCLWSLTFELRRDRQQNARPAWWKMRQPTAQAWRFDVGPRLERGVRPQCGKDAWHKHDSLPCGDPCERRQARSRRIRASRRSEEHVGCLPRVTAIRRLHPAVLPVLHG